MEQDDLKRLLHRKLAHTQAEPPIDMWARLEERLPDIRRELAFGDGGGASSPPDAVPAFRIRRPLRHKMKWAYVAASVAAVGIMVFTVRNLPQLEMIAGDGIAVEENNVPARVQGPSEQPRSLDQPEIYGQTAAFRATGPSRMTTGPAVTSDEDPAGYPVVEGTVEIPDGSSAGSVETTPNAGQTAERHTAAQGSKEKTSDMKRQEEFAAWMARARAEEGRRGRRTAPVAASLYAANGAGVASNGTVTGRTRLQNSSLIVNESTEYPGDETADVSFPSFSSASLKHDLPLGFGVSVNIGVANKLSIETGLTYTFMKSRGETVNITNNYTATNTVTQKLHYLGIPLKVKYDFLQTRVVDLYAGAGVSVEKLVSGKRTWTANYNGDKEFLGTEKVKVGSLQASAGANLGLEFNLDRRMGLYVEPGVGYFFENGNQPESYRTENPFNFTVKAGFRIKL